MRILAKLAPKLRAMRAVVAVCILGALLAVYYLDRREQEALRIATLETAMGMNWRLNDVIVESLTVKNIADQLMLSDGLSADERAALFRKLLLRYEILWSNSEIAKQTDLRNYERFYTQLVALETYLLSIEDEMYGDVPPKLELLSALAREVEAVGQGLQRAWQDTRYFSVEMFIGREQEQFAQMEAIKRQTLVLLLIFLLTLYLVFEAYLVGKMRRQGDRLKAQAEHAAMASEAKSIFLANVSHEIRTPLNGILGMTTELEETELNTDQRACLQVISHAGDVLLHTLNDVLDLSKVESGQLEVEMRVFDLHETLDAAVALYSARAEEKSLSLTLNRSVRVPRCVEGDAQRISQILHNLIGNAIKFTDAGSVTVTADYAGRTGFLRLAVEDTGSGIAPAVQEKIFEPFSQADGSITRTKGGTGLGLTISRGLCEAMGGKLGLTSELGKGATFWFELPLPDRTEVVQDAAFETVAKGGRPISTLPMHLIGQQNVLIVDDNATNRLVLRRFLKSAPFIITEASDGEEAVEATRDTTFDVILMDVQMPIMDGIAATKIIRDLESRTGRPAAKIVAVTANVMTHQIAGYLDSGFDEVLGKPIAKAALLALFDTSTTGAA